MNNSRNPLLFIPKIILGGFMLFFIFIVMLICIPLILLARITGRKKFNSASFHAFYSKKAQKDSDSTIQLNNDIDNLEHTQIIDIDAKNVDDDSSKK